MTVYPDHFKPPRRMIVHLVTDPVPTGEVPTVRTRCGRTIDHPVVSAAGPTRYDLIARNGNQFFCSTQSDMITCVKCRHLLTVDANHVRPSRPASPQKRTVAHARAAAPRTARPHSRPRA